MGEVSGGTKTSRRFMNLTAMDPCWQSSDNGLCWAVCRPIHSSRMASEFRNNKEARAEYRKQHETGGPRAGNRDRWGLPNPHSSDSMPHIPCMFVNIPNKTRCICIQDAQDILKSLLPAMAIDRTARKVLSELCDET